MQGTPAHVRRMSELTSSPILLSPVKCKSSLNERIIGRMTQRTTQVPIGSPGPVGAADRAALPARFGPLPRESLDALVTVLDEVRLGRSVSRSELVARTGLGRAIVAQRVGELIERGLIAEGDVGPSTGGRPPRQLTFRADAGHLLVADLGRHQHRRGRHDPRRADPRASRRAGAHRRRTGRLPRPGRGVVRAPAADDPRGPGQAVGDRDRRPGPGGVPVRSADLAADHARLGRVPGPRALRRALLGARSGSTTTSTSWPSASGGRVSRSATTTSSWSRSGRASGPASSRTVASIAARRAAPATSVTSRWSTTRPWSAAAATSAAWRPWPAVRRWAARVRRRPARVAVPA